MSSNVEIEIQVLPRVHYSGTENCDKLAKSNWEGEINLLLMVIMRNMKYSYFCFEKHELQSLNNYFNL